MFNRKAKRRRLDDGASILSRPFKSPLRKDVPPKQNAITTTISSSKAESDQQLHKPSSGAQAVSSRAIQSSDFIISSNKPPVRNSKIPTGLQRVSSPASDPEVAALRRKRIRLQSQLASLRSELDTVQQALRIEASPRDDELKGLVIKWRGVSQRAAEELFETAKDKIERTGGVSAWRERERERLQRSQMWEDEDFYERSEISGANRKEIALTTPCTGKDEGKEGVVGGETFTMDMMLKSLNIELDVIGFNEVEEKWVSNR